MSTVELLTRARRGKALGLIGAENLKLDWRAVIERKDRIVASWSKGKEVTPAKLAIPVLRGKGIFMSPHEINVDGRNYCAEKFVIATGSQPAPCITSSRRSAGRFSIRWRVDQKGLNRTT